MRRTLIVLALLAMAAPLTASALAPVDTAVQAVSGPVSMNVLTGYSPPVVVVASGGSVTWTNGDVAPHTVTAIGTASFDVHLNPGQSLTLQFAGPSVVPYHCTIHPWMNGVIVVTP
ncbi:MAG: hypothetical protein LC624_00245 [Halobacteriales archaeon]|nr:hypothetical protein [Halobacteriales archaeon]